MLLAISPVIAHENGYHWDLVNDGALIVSSTEDTVGFLDLGFPSIIEVPSWVTAKPDPEARFYMYYGEHHGKAPTLYIRMKWAKNITGPWTEYNVGEESHGHTLRGVMDFVGDSYRNVPEADRDGHTATGWAEDWMKKGHVAAPDVYIDEENRVFIMAFHGDCGLGSITHDDGETTDFPHTGFVAFSKDGLNFNDPETGGGQGGVWGPAGSTLPFGPLEQEALYNGKVIQRTQDVMKSYFRLFALNGNLYGYGQGNKLGGRRPLYRPVVSTNAWKVPAGLVHAKKRFKTWWEECDTAHITEFLNSPEFAQHPKNPHPGNLIEPGYRVNHPEVVKLSEERVEVYLYIKPNTTDDTMFSQLLRVELDVSDPDWNNWEVAKNSATGEAIFDVVADPVAVYEAVQDAIGGGDIDGELYADPIRMGVPGVIRVEGTNYCFIGFKGEDSASQARPMDSEGQIACLILTPKETVYSAESAGFYKLNAREQ